MKDADNVAVSRRIKALQAVAIRHNSDQLILRRRKPGEKTSEHRKD